MSEKRGSNSRPSAWEADALPTELLSRGLVVQIYAQKAEPQGVAGLVNLRGGIGVFLDMANVPLSSGSRRLVGLLLVISGILLGLGQLIRVGLAFYTWSQTSGLNLVMLLVNLLALVGAGLLVRYGRRLLRGGQLRDGPADETIL